MVRESEGQPGRLKDRQPKRKEGSREGREPERQPAGKKGREKGKGIGAPQDSREKKQTARPEGWKGI